MDGPSIPEEEKAPQAPVGADLAEWWRVEGQILFSDITLIRSNPYSIAEKAWKASEMHALRVVYNKMDIDQSCPPVIRYNALDVEFKQLEAPKLAEGI